MSLCSLEDVKSYLLIENSTNDTLLTSLISASSAFIENYTSRIFAITDYTEIVNGTGGAKMPVRYSPITEITSVKIDDISVDIKNTSSIIYFSNGNIFPAGIMNVELKYKAGYATIPSDVKQACIELVAYKFKQRDRIGHVSKSLAGEVITFEQRDINSDIKRQLASYIRVV